MATGIGYEASTMCSVASDIDLYRYKYKDFEKQIDGSNVDISFVSPVFSVYENHRFMLLANSRIEQMTPRWRYRPDYLSYDKYGTTAWWQLLMWLNDIKSIEYFTTDTVIVPTKDAVANIEQEAYLSGGYIDINEDTKHRETLFTLYMLPTSNIEKIKNTPVQNTFNELVENTTEVEKEFNREIFDLTIPMLRMRYVDLQYEPIEDSIKMIANCRPNLIYNKHYKLIEDNNKSRRRITWDPEIINNAGLLFKLKENDTLEIQYVRNKK